MVAFGAPALVGDGGVVIRTQLTKGDLGARLRGVVQADRDRDHPERDHAFPHRSRHGDAVYLLSQSLATFRRFRRLCPGNLYAPTSRLCIASIELPRPARASSSIKARFRPSIPSRSGVPKSLNADKSWSQTGSLEMAARSVT